MHIYYIYMIIFKLYIMITVYINDIDGEYTNLISSWLVESAV